MYQDASGFYAYYSKTANNVCVNIYIIYEDTANNYLDVGLVLPEGYRPIRFFWNFGLNDITDEASIYLVGTDGSIKIRGIGSNTTKHLLCCFSFKTP